MHIVEGLLIALANIDEVVHIIKTSKTPDIAILRLTDSFLLTETQAKAILDMRLYQLTGLEREKLEAEARALHERIAYLKELLADDRKLYGVMKDDLLAIRKDYADARRTEIVTDDGDLDIKDLIADEDCVISLSHAGYVMRTSTSVFREQMRGGMVVVCINSKD